jgi:hypothetical protein
MNFCFQLFYFLNLFNVLGIPELKEIPEISESELKEVPEILFNSVLIQFREFQELMELDQFRLGRYRNIMIELQELEGIDSGGWN